MRKRLAILALALTICAPPALAHKLKVFATAIGAEISGYGYFAPGGRAQDSAVSVTLPDGRVQATLRTNAEGEFAFVAQTRADHVFTLDAGDGHVATYRIAAAELPDTLPGAGAAPAIAATPAPQAQTAKSDVSSAEIRAMVEQGVAHQLRPLREQIDAWQEKVWLHDVLGGLGYIIGLASLAYGLSANRRSKPQASSAMKEARR